MIGAAVAKPAKPESLAGDYSGVDAPEFLSFIDVGRDWLVGRAVKIAFDAEAKTAAHGGEFGETDSPELGKAHAEIAETPVHIVVGGVGGISWKSG